MYWGMVYTRKINTELLSVDSTLSTKKSWPNLKKCLINTLVTVKCLKITFYYFLSDFDKLINYKLWTLTDEKSSSCPSK